MMLARDVSPFQGLGSKVAICRPGPYGTRQWLFRPFGPEELSTSYAPAKCQERCCIVPSIITESIQPATQSRALRAMRRS
jgi:hypothetical protein